MQLVAYGAQDIYLSGNPQITFFKVVYRRHTNFAVESIEQTHNGSAAPGSKISVTVSRNGDLLSQVWIANTISGAKGLLAVNAFDNIDNVEVEIGGQVIDKQYGHWMQVWTDLTHGNAKNGLLTSCATAAATTGAVSYVPLQFWFCRNPGLALPLIALQYHEVKLNITFSSTATASTRLGSIGVWCDYVFLDTDERRRFAQVSHEYLIEQVQYSNALSVKGTNTQHELRFNHPVKELVWTVDHISPTLAEQDITVTKALLQLNGHDRFKKRSGKYFTTVQRYQHHTGNKNAVYREALSSTPLTATATGDITSSGKEVAVHGSIYTALATRGGDIVKITNVDSTGALGGAPALVENTLLIARNTLTSNKVNFFNITDGLETVRAGSGSALEVTGEIPNNLKIEIPVLAAHTSVPHVYSFALKPEEHQPSGTCNFSRIDNAVLNMEHDAVTTKGTLKVYAVNYNVLRIMSGMGGLAYSN